MYHEEGTRILVDCPRAIWLNFGLTRLYVWFPDIQWTTTISQKCGNNCAVPVQFGIAKWIFVGCIMFSFVLVSDSVLGRRNQG